MRRHDYSRLLNPPPKPESLYQPLPKSKGVTKLNAKRVIGVRVLSKKAK